MHTDRLQMLLRGGARAVHYARQKRQAVANFSESRAADWCGRRSRDAQQTVFGTPRSFATGGSLPRPRKGVGNNAGGKSGARSGYGGNFQNQNARPQARAVSPEVRRMRLERLRGKKLEVVQGTPLAVGKFADAIQANVDDLYFAASELGVEFLENPQYALRVAKHAGAADQKSRRQLQLAQTEARKHAFIGDEEVEILAAELGLELIKTQPKVIDVKPAPKPEKAVYDTWPARPPVVTIMGHVDHGKTTLLDALRSTHIAAGEAGGITQAIGAFEVGLQGKSVTFLDTPGHEAFTSMRLRGATCTDIVVLVVAVDSGVKAQTLEAISHARAAGASIIVALNKVDVVGTDPNRVMGELASEAELIVEQVGGDTPCVPISAKQRTNLDSLIEMILLQAEILELRGNPAANAEAICIEARLDPKMGGVIANCVNRQGTLHVGDVVVAGTTWGRVRSLISFTGGHLKQVGPSQPFALLGLKEVLQGGEDVIQVESESKAQEVVAFRQKKIEDQLALRDTKIAIGRAHADKRTRKEILSNDPSLLHAKNKWKLAKAWREHADAEKQQQEGTITLNLVLKADTRGGADALMHTMEGMELEGAQTRVVHVGIGAVNNSDITLAAVDKGIVINFCSQAGSGAKGDKVLANAISPALKAEALQHGVTIMNSNVIFRLLEKLEEFVELKRTGGEVITVLGKAEVRQLFGLSGKASGTVVAGCKVVDGSLKRSQEVRVMRMSAPTGETGAAAESKLEQVFRGSISSLKHLRDEVPEIKTGMECGIVLTDFPSIAEGDIIESIESKLA
ncbi:Translation initiation factor IF-2 [Porphyridium purpureum]|uniref:Translation initiation factor IF-2 n=1 Tax=Porphyridium purpureum TaxID=35688 RepID=A0A5J4Z9C2_PORPP|nr:Translation initiation factor IF-2 [Porphyridium purpureum]|eukprot:POR2922..scf295_1